MNDEEPVVKITLTAIYERVVSVEKQVGTLSDQLPNHVSITKEKQDEYDTRLENHGTQLGNLDSRITILEAKQVPKQPWYAIAGGVVAIITGLGSLIAVLAVLSRLGQIV